MSFALDRSFEPRPRVGRPARHHRRPGRRSPLGGTDAEITGILTALEDVGAATFAPPTRTTSATTARPDCCATRCASGVRSSAGPFRSFGDIAVEPRPYQLVPLLMALRLDPSGCSSPTTSASARPSRPA